jgi:hypothetical protein
MTKEGWPEVRIEPSIGDGYAVAYRRLPEEAHRRARRLSPGIQARYDREAAPGLSAQGEAQ